MELKYIAKAYAQVSQSNVGNQTEESARHNPADSVEEFAKTVLRIIIDLCDKNEPAVVLFQEAYEKRSRQQGFREANRLFGLTGVLTDLLRELPPDECFKATHIDSSKARVEPAFMNSMQTAICKIARNRGYVFEVMQKNTTKHHKDLKDLLPALFRFYVANEEVLPF